MIRPEAAATLKRYRGLLIGLGVTGLGIYWAAYTGDGLLRWVGWASVPAGLALIVTGWQRLRFDQGEGGPGIVRVTEARVTYFGPLSGGVADLDSLTSVTLDPGAKPAHWLLQRPGEPALAIPVNAEGAEALFDLFAHLPGIRTREMLRALEGGAGAPVTVWRRPDPDGKRLGLH